MTSEPNELEFDRGPNKHIPAFSFFGKNDYMANETKTEPETV